MTDADTHPPGYDEALERAQDPRAAFIAQVAPRYGHTADTLEQDWEVTGCRCGRAGCRGWKMRWRNYAR